MTTALKSIAEKVEKLPTEDRVFLAERLLASLDDADLEKQWVTEAASRRDEIRSGKSKNHNSFPGEVYNRIERLLVK